MSALIDFSRLPAPTAVQALDYEAVLDVAIARLQQILPGWDKADVESDPASKLLEVYAYLDLLLRGRINDAVRALLLAKAVGADLDQLAANVGTARLSGEADDRLRERAQQAFWAVSAAGPANAYRWHAMSVDASIADVSVTQTAPGQVAVTVLAPLEVDPDDYSEEDLALGLAAFGAEDTIIAPADGTILLAVAAAVDAEDVRPLTDAVTVRAPTVIPFTVGATLTLYPGPDAALVLAESRAALSGYLAQIRHMGYDATRSGLIDALLVPGVQNVVLAAPAADIECTPLELSLCTATSITVSATRRV